jgi:hypothetical protein
VQYQKKTEGSDVSHRRSSSKEAFAKKNPGSGKKAGRNSIQQNGNNSNSSRNGSGAASSAANNAQSSATDLLNLGGPAVSDDLETDTDLLNEKGTGAVTGATGAVTPSQQAAGGNADSPMLREYILQLDEAAQAQLMSISLRFARVDDAQSLQLKEIPELLREYKHMAKFIHHLKMATAD